MMIRVFLYTVYCIGKVSNLHDVVSQTSPLSKSVRCLKWIIIIIISSSSSSSLPPSEDDKPDDGQYVRPKHVVLYFIATL
jgi:hypothetical protein